MRLQVKEGDLSAEVLEDILDIFVRAKTAGTQLRVETKLVTALIREILYLQKETCPMCEFSIAEGIKALPCSPRDPKAITLKPNASVKVEEFMLSESLLEKSPPPPEAIKEETKPAEPGTDEQLPDIIEEAPKTKKPLLLRGKISSRPKEKPSLRIWIILGLILFNVSWITALIAFLF